MILAKRSRLLLHLIGVFGRDCVGYAYRQQLVVLNVTALTSSGIWEAGAVGKLPYPDENNTMALDVARRQRSFTV